MERFTNFCLFLYQPCLAGNRLRVKVKSKRTVLSVTDSMGNTYQKHPEKSEWIARCIRGGHTVVSVLLSSK